MATITDRTVLRYDLDFFGDSCGVSRGPYATREAATRAARLTLCTTQVDVIERVRITETSLAWDQPSVRTASNCVARMHGDRLTLASE